MSKNRIIRLIAVLAVLAMLAVLATAAAAAAPEAPGIPGDFEGYKPAFAGEVWVWDKSEAHPGLTRCRPGQAEGLWYPPKGSQSSSNYAACNASFSLAKYAVAIDGIPAICTGTDVVPMNAAASCTKIVPTGKVGSSRVQ